MRLLLPDGGVDPIAGDSLDDEWRAAMKSYAGLDVGGKRTAVCILDDAGKIVWRGMADTHPEIIDAVLRRFKGALTKVGLESRPVYAAFVPLLDDYRLPNDLHGRAAGGGCDQKPSDQERPKRRLCTCRDAADWLVHIRPRQVCGQPSLESPARRAGSIGQGQAFIGEPGARPSAAIRHNPAVARRKKFAEAAY